MPSAKLLFHPTLLASRAAEIAEREKGAGLRNPARIERDARGRPFIQAADPLAPPAAPVEPEMDPMRFERLRRALEALAAWLPAMEEPGRVYPDPPRGGALVLPGRPVKPR
jgi:hypothetical protein